MNRPWVEAGFDDLVDLSERRSAVPCREGVDRRVEQPVGELEQGHRTFVGQPSGPEPAMSWSSTDSESRTDPPPARTTKDSTPGATGTPSCSRRCSM